LFEVEIQYVESIASNGHGKGMSSDAGFATTVPNTSVCVLTGGVD